MWLPFCLARTSDTLSSSVHFYFCGCVEQSRRAHLGCVRKCTGPASVVDLLHQFLGVQFEWKRFRGHSRLHAVVSIALLPHQSFLSSHSFLCAYLVASISILFIKLNIMLAFLRVWHPGTNALAVIKLQLRGRFLP